MKVPDNTPAVLSLGKLCDENGYSYEWINGQKPHLIKKRDSDNFAIRKTSFLSWFQACQVLPLHLHQLYGHPFNRRGHSSSSSSSSPSSPTAGEIQVREREDVPNSDISPVPVSELVDDRSGKPEEIQANEIPKPNKKETTIERGNPCGDSEIPEWLQEFREIFGG